MFTASVTTAAAMVIIVVMMTTAATMIIAVMIAIATTMIGGEEFHSLSNTKGFPEYYLACTASACLTYQLVYFLSKASALPGPLPFGSQVCFVVW